MSKTIAQVFDELPEEIKPDIYYIVGWSFERNKVHPLIRQYEDGKNLNNLHAVHEWCWFGKLTEEQKLCIAAIVKQAVWDKEN